MSASPHWRKGAGNAKASLFALVSHETALSFVSVMLVLVAWQLLNPMHLIPSGLVSTPLNVARTFLNILKEGYRDTSLAQDFAATLYRGGLGFLLAVTVGVPLGLAMGYNNTIRSIFEYPIQFLRPLPPLSYFVLLILWLGTGNASKITLLYLTSLPVVVINSMAGVKSAKLQKVQAARSLGASESQIFRYVILPSALPMIFTGLRISMAITFSTVVAAEIMAATDGLGWMVWSASQYLRNDIVVMSIILLGIIGILLNKLILVADATVVHWRGVE